MSFILITSDIVSSSVFFILNSFVMPVAEGIAGGPARRSDRGGATAALGAMVEALDAMVEALGAMVAALDTDATCALPPVATDLRGIAFAIDCSKLTANCSKLTRMYYRANEKFMGMDRCAPLKFCKV